MSETLRPTEADLAAADAWVNRVVGKSVVVRISELRAAKDGYLAGVLAERARAARAAELMLQGFSYASNGTVLISPEVIATAIRKGP